MTVLVTGANGLVGRALIDTMHQRGVACRGVVRRAALQRSADDVVMPEQNGQTDWQPALAGVSVVIHCAAQTRVTPAEAADPKAAYRQINVAGTLQLARQAAAAGVQRFVFVSSVKVNGEQTLPGKPFTAAAAPAPEDAYGRSKAEAEAGLQDIARHTGMALVIVRPPLIYGPGVRGNFASLWRWVAAGIPLPFAALTQNRRSLVALDNLVDLLLTCVHHAQAVGQVFLVSDGEDVSTAELLRRMAQAQGRSARLLWLPAGLMQWAARVLGKQAVAQRLCGSLQVDSAATCRQLGWHPPLTLDEGLRRVAES